MSSVLEKRRKMNERRRNSGGGGNFSQFRGIFMNFVEGPNVVRLVGDMLEAHTHYIAPSKQRGDRGLCVASAFQGDGRLPQTINCLNWDLEKEEWKPEKVCPICRLNALAKQALREDPTPEEKEFFDKLSGCSYASFRVKWNVIDRDDPFVDHVENGSSIKVLGLKVATIGSEAWKYIDGIFDQTQMDITDPEGGIDICIVRGKNNMRTTYTANAILDGTSLKVTPLTEEERALKLHDLKVLCGKMLSPEQIIGALHGDLRELLEVNPDDNEGASATTEDDDPDAIVPAQKKRG